MVQIEIRYTDCSADLEVRGHADSTKHEIRANYVPAQVGEASETPQAQASDVWR